MTVPYARILIGGFIGGPLLAVGDKLLQPTGIVAVLLMLAVMLPIGLWMQRPLLHDLNKPSRPQS